MNDRLQKILRLALNGAAEEGEWHAAAVRFIAILRSEGVEASAVSVRSSVPVSGPSSGPSPDDYFSGFRRWTDPVYRQPPPRPKPPPPARPDGAPAHVLLKAGRFAGKYLAELSLTGLQTLLRDTNNERLATFIQAEINWRVKTRRTRPQS